MCLYWSSKILILLHVIAVSPLSGWQIFCFCTSTYAERKHQCHRWWCSVCGYDPHTSGRVPTVQAHSLIFTFTASIPRGQKVLTKFYCSILRRSLFSHSLVVSKVWKQPKTWTTAQHSVQPSNNVSQHLHDCAVKSLFCSDGVTIWGDVSVSDPRGCGWTHINS